MRRLTVCGFVLTAIWIGVFGFALYWYYPEILKLSLNEWGDFLAGFTAPLAFLWLVVGYFQQGDELRLNTEALKAQQEELRRQVEETAVLARNAERQAEAAEQVVTLNKTEQEREESRIRLEAQPIFVARGGSSSRGEIKTGIVNRGGEVYEVVADSDAELDFQMPLLNAWQHGQEMTITVREGELAIEYPFRFQIQYRDRFGDVHQKTFEFVERHKFSEVETE